ncbi:30790_t:CDS:2, partial [Racocetra persica]
MTDYNYFRNLWWKEGNIHPGAKWEEVTLPYVLAEGMTLDEYERRTDSHTKFVLAQLLSILIDIVVGTDASILNIGATRTRADSSGKEADASFHPMKQRNEPWPNIIVEVAYFESIDHVFEKVKNYWLKDLSRAHDAIVVKIDPVPEGETPSRMQKDKRGELHHRTHFEFGTHDGAGNPLNISRGICIIKINLDCLYHQIYPGIQVPRDILPDPIELDFSFVRDEIF